MRWMTMGAVAVALMAVGFSGARGDEGDKTPPPDPAPLAAPAAQPADPVPAAGAAATDPAGPMTDEQAAAALRARYRRVNGEWWFYTNTKSWKYYRDNQWIDFDPATYQPPQLPAAAVQPATSSGGTVYYSQPSGGYRSGPRVYIGTGVGYPGGFGGYPYGRYPYGGSGMGIGISFGGRRW